MKLLGEAEYFGRLDIQKDKYEIEVQERSYIEKTCNMGLFNRVQFRLHCSQCETSKSGTEPSQVSQKDPITATRSWLEA